MPSIKPMLSWKLAKSFIDKAIRHTPHSTISSFENNLQNSIIYEIFLVINYYKFEYFYMFEKINSFFFVKLQN